MAIDQNVQSSRLDRRFDTLRNKVSQDAGAAAQQQQEAMARKGAATGAGNTGAFLKLGEKVRQEGENAKQNALADVEGQREGAQAQLDEQNAQRDFAKSERLGSQDFSQNMAQQQMKFATGERLGSQVFQSSEAAAQRGFSRELFNKDMAFKQKVQKDALNMFDQQRADLARQFTEDQRVSDFNMDMATKEYNKKDIMESMQNAVGYDPRGGGSTGGGYGKVWSTGQSAGGSVASKFGA